MHRTSGGSPRVTIVIVCQSRVDPLVRCLRSLARNLTREIPTETIVVLNATADADRERARPHFRNAHVITSPVELGFAGGVNRAAAVARSEYLVALSDDGEVRPGWLEALLDAADRYPDAAAVGSKLLRPDGTLQEAGGIIYGDGSAGAVGAGLHAGLGHYNYLRQVDYASACSLLIRRAAFGELGGFDERSFPGYGADVDLGITIRRRRGRVLYQPRSVVVLHRAPVDEHANTFLRERSRDLLQKKWGPELRRFVDPGTVKANRVEVALHRARGNPRRLLIIDDRVPDPGVGAGFARMYDAIHELARAGYAISFYATMRRIGSQGAELQDLGVNMIEGAPTTALAPPGTVYDVGVISRPHNLQMLRRLKRYQPGCLVVYDAEALGHRRLELQASVLAATDPEAGKHIALEAARMKRLEHQAVVEADRVVSVSEVEADMMRSIPGHCPIEVIEPRLPEKNRITPGSFSQRSGILFVAGWSAAYPSPNSDSLEWLVKEVLPLVKQRLPSARLSVTGANPPSQVECLAGPSVQFLGYVDDLSRVYDAARVVVEPVRFGAGVKAKAVEAIQQGVPLVTTTVGAEGVDGAAEPAVSVHDDPGRFAERLVMLLDDRAAWEAARAAILDIHARWNSSPPKSWESILENALKEKWIGSTTIAH